MNQIIIAIRFIFKHKWKIIVTLNLTIVFLFLIFPMSDLNDFISNRIAQATNNQVYLQFEELSINPLTSSVSVSKVSIDTPKIDSLTVEQIDAAPSILGLIQQKPAGKIFASGLLGGQLALKVSPAATENKDIQKSELDLSIEAMSLKEIRQLLHVQLPFSGQLNLNSKAVVDFAFAEQPEGDVSLNIQKFELSSGSVQIPEMGSLNVPEIKLGKMDIKGRLQGGKFVIENGQIGQASDELSGSIKGELGLVFQTRGGQIQPVVSTYNLSIDLLAKPAFKEKASFFLTFIDQYKRVEANNTRYKFKLTSTAPGMPPQFSPLN